VGVKRLILLAVAVAAMMRPGGSEARDFCKPAPEYGPDAVVCDGGGVPGWNYLHSVRVGGVARD